MYYTHACLFICTLPSPRVFELRVSNSLAGHGVPAVVEAVRHVENDRGVVGQEVVANLIENLWRVRERGKASVKRRVRGEGRK